MHFFMDQLEVGSEIIENAKLHKIVPDFLVKGECWWVINIVNIDIQIAHTHTQRASFVKGLHYKMCLDVYFSPIHI